CEDCKAHMIGVKLLRCTLAEDVNNWKELVNNLETKSYKYKYIINFGKKFTEDNNKNNYVEIAKK
ncbi:hypothetical protein ACI65C_009243, partial [Semiaphis heraclei]